MNTDFSSISAGSQANFGIAARRQEYGSFDGWQQGIPMFTRMACGVQIGLAVDVFCDMLGQFESFSLADQEVLMKAKEDAAAPDEIRQASLHALKISRQQKIREDSRALVILGFATPRR